VRACRTIMSARATATSQDCSPRSTLRNERQTDD
jgi:hypothetical protein